MNRQSPFSASFLLSFPFTLHFPLRRVAAIAKLGVALFCLASAWTVDAESSAAVLPAVGPISAKTMSQLLLTDGARIGNRVVAVGDRGYVVWSDSNGENWERAQAPANLPLLNAIFFTDAKNGWAVGHDAVILHSVDEGKTWTQSFSAPSEQKPLMDILFIDAMRGFTVGAYGAFYETVDGGKTWNPRKIQDEDKHLNSIIKLGENRLLIVGEAGTILQSEDAGKLWSKVASPYKGSFFGAIQAQDGAVIIYGLRGRIFRSRDSGMKDWAQIETKSTASIMGATRLPDGALVLAGLAGTVLVSRDNGQSFVTLPTRSTKAIAAPLLGAPNALLLLGEAGARSVLLPSAVGAAASSAPPAKK